MVDYLVGADGAHSERLPSPLYLLGSLTQPLGIVRKLLGLTFIGVTRPSDRTIVADIEIKGLTTDVSMGLLHRAFKGTDIAVCSIGILGEASRPERTSEFIQDI